MGTKTTNWRPADWNRLKDPLVCMAPNFMTQAQVSQIIETVADAILAAFLESNEFEKEACQFCAEQGWREPY